MTRLPTPQELQDLLRRDPAAFAEEATRLSKLTTDPATRAIWEAAARSARLLAETHTVR